MVGLGLGNVECRMMGVSQHEKMEGVRLEGRKRSRKGLCIDYSTWELGGVVLKGVLKSEEIRTK